MPPPARSPAYHRNGCLTLAHLDTAARTTSYIHHNNSLAFLTMPDIDTLSKKRIHSPTPDTPSDETTSSEEDEGDDDVVEELVVPDACLACGKEKVTHLTVPCRHPCLCRGCAMKMATGGRCKVSFPYCVYPVFMYVWFLVP